MTWTREQAIRDVVEASDGHGREWVDRKGAVVQPCVYDLALELRRNPGRTIVLAPGEEWFKGRLELGPRDRLVRRCRRPGCPKLFPQQGRKRYCSLACGIRERRRLVKRRTRALRHPPTHFSF